MGDRSLEELFQGTLMDIYYAERRILKALPNMARGAQSENLRYAFTRHHEQTETQIARLQEVFALIDEPARGRSSTAIDGIIEEGEEILATFQGLAALDAGLIAAALALEHYEIARYVSLRQWARILGLEEAVLLLDQTLEEESDATGRLQDLAESEVNRMALQAA